MTEKLEWSASSGRVERMLIFYLGLAVGAFFIRILILLLIFIIPTTLKRLLSDKLVREVSIDDKSRSLIITCRKSTVEIPFEELGFAFDHDHKTFNELIFYRTYIGTRGQLVKNYISDIIGMKWTTSWKKSQTSAISEELIKRDIAQFKPTYKELPLWERFI